MSTDQSFSTGVNLLARERRTAVCVVWNEVVERYQVIELRKLPDTLDEGPARAAGYYSVISSHEGLHGAHVSMMAARKRRQRA